MHDGPLRPAMVRKAAELVLEDDEENPPRNLDDEEWLVPVPPPACEALEFIPAVASPESLVLRRGPESEKSLPDTCKHIMLKIFY